MPGNHTNYPISSRKYYEPHTRVTKLTPEHYSKINLEKFIAQIENQTRGRQSYLVNEVRLRGFRG